MLLTATSTFSFTMKIFKVKNFLLLWGCCKKTFNSFEWIFYDQSMHFSSRIIFLLLMSNLNNIEILQKLIKWIFFNYWNVFSMQNEQLREFFISSNRWRRFHIKFYSQNWFFWGCKIDFIFQNDFSTFSIRKIQREIEMATNGEENSEGWKNKEICMVQMTWVIF